MLPRRHWLKALPRTKMRIRSFRLSLKKNAATVASVDWHQEVALVQSLQSDNRDCGDVSDPAAATREGTALTSWMCAKFVGEVHSELDDTRHAEGNFAVLEQSLEDQMASKPSFEETRRSATPGASRNLKERLRK